MFNIFVNMEFITARIVGFFTMHSISGGVLHVFDIMKKEMYIHGYPQGGRSPEFRL